MVMKQADLPADLQLLVGRATNAALGALLRQIGGEQQVSLAAIQEFADGPYGVAIELDRDPVRLRITDKRTLGPISDPATEQRIASMMARLRDQFEQRSRTALAAAPQCGVDRYEVVGLVAEVDDALARIGPPIVRAIVEIGCAPAVTSMLTIICNAALTLEREHAIGILASLESAIVNILDNRPEVRS